MSIPDGFTWDEPDVCWDDPQTFWDYALSPPPGRKRMSNIPVESALGYAQQAGALLTNYKAAMITKGVDPTATIADLTAKGATLTTKNETQEATKTLLRQQTEDVNATKDDLEKVASAACDMILAAYGRTSEEAKEATRLRNSIYTTIRRTPTPTPPTP
jgi:hypothetical protein